MTLGPTPFEPLNFFWVMQLSVAAASLNYGGNEADIYGGAFLKSPNGMFSEVGFGFDNYYQCNYELWGSKGKITSQRAFTPKPNQEPEITIETPDGNSHHTCQSGKPFQISP